MYASKKTIGLSYELLKNKAFEKKETLNILNALIFYRNKKKIINNKDIYMLDIGGHIGWYPSFLGRYGFSILTFEPFPLNFYVSHKNYCHLNKNSSVIIINKGLYNKEKICPFYKDKYGISNGMISCNDKRRILLDRFIKFGKVELTRLSNFIPYLSDKNIALIKLDAEGSEEKAIKSGIELITKYHVPFIFIEFTPKFLINHKSNPKDFIQFFIDNGYVISQKGFLDKSFITFDELIAKINYQINIYLTYKEFIDLK